MLQRLALLTDFQKKGIVFLVLLVVSSLLNHSVSIGDCDAVAYIIGARSLREGLGFSYVSGEPIVLWPRGYSQILSVFPNALSAAWILNQVCLAGAVTGIIFFLVRRGWTFFTALGLGAALAFSFFRPFVFVSKPDMLAYFLFALGLHQYVQNSLKSRSLAYGVWIFLIPIKSVAIFFVPAALLANVLIAWRNKTRASLPLALGMLFAGLWGSAVWMAPPRPLQIRVAKWTGEPNAPRDMYLGFRSHMASRLSAAKSWGRTTLAYWYGPLDTGSKKAAFAIVFLIGLAGLLSLQVRFFSPEAVFGQCLLGLMFLASIAIGRITEPRLMGYGFLVLLVASTPRLRFRWIWPLYGTVTLGFALWNATAVKDRGLLEARYANLAQEFAAAKIPEGERLTTNSFLVLDYYLKRQTEHIFTPLLLPKEGLFLWVTGRPKSPASFEVAMKAPGPEWCELTKFSIATLFRYCGR